MFASPAPPYPASLIHGTIIGNAMAPVIILPGLGNSGPDHWQSLWQRRDPASRRFAPADWDRPMRDDWLRALDAAVAAAAEPPLLVAHSLACLLVAHWAARSAAQPVRGAFLVAPPDPDGPAFPAETATFRDPPANTLPFPALVVASSDDPFGAVEAARRLAASWGAGFVIAGALGHINSASGVGDWPQGAALFEAFRAGTGA